ncbi:NACHT domain-containing protein [Pedobacter miscanthi]|uniref:NACHT domain-containing protein n=1 Tax=Pedobacter miscanthi TaxID=2259170 RepID=UPI0029307B02|nr:NACHT domain-containing protein [Pedobacter miscanthi]
MGRLYDRFNAIKYENEAEVSQNFIIPLLTEFLGWGLMEVLPEKHYPARDLFSGVKFAQGQSKRLTHRPDFVVCLEGKPEQVRFIIDSKGPGEEIDTHVGQLKSYSNSVGRNFIMITNGKEIKVFSANDLLFYAKDIAALQMFISHLEDLLSRKNQLSYSPIELIQRYDYSAAVAAMAIAHPSITQRMLMLSDFNTYISSVHQRLNNWHFPSGKFSAFEEIDFRKFDPTEFIEFSLATEKTGINIPAKPIPWFRIASFYGSRLRVLSGGTGSGKTTLLRFLAFSDSARCMNYSLDKVPVLILLRKLRINDSLAALIKRELFEDGYINNDIDSIISQGRLRLYIDGYDEVPESCLRDLDIELSEISTRCECILTTREHRLPDIRDAVLFEIRPLSLEHRERIVREYLPANHYDFSYHLNQSGLMQESGNMLILLFLIALFLKKQQMPDGISAVTAAVVEHVRLWNLDKYRNNQSPLDWRTLDILYSRLAIELTDRKLTELDFEQFSELILEVLKPLEMQRHVRSGLLIEEVTSAMCSTGLVINSGEQVFFWHRLFLNYFSARYVSNMILKRDPRASELVGRLPAEIVVGLCAMLSSCEQVFECLPEDLLLRSHCLIENPNCSEREKKEILQYHFSHCDSPVKAIRTQSLFFLERISDAQIDCFFLDVFDREVYDEVIMSALVQISRRRLKGAKEIVYRYRDWNENLELLHPTSNAAVLEALSYFGEAELLIIIENWKKFENIFTAQSCKDIFVRIFTEGRLSMNVLNALEKLFEEEYFADHQRDQILSTIAEIFAISGHESFIPRYLSLIANTKRSSKMWSTTRLLSAVKQREVKDQILTFILSSGHENASVEVAKWLASSETYFSVGEVKTLLECEVFSIKITGVKALGRFDAHEVLGELIKYVSQGDPRLQGAALIAMLNNGAIVGFIEDHPGVKLFIKSLVTVLEGVRRFYLIDASSFLSRVHAFAKKEMTRDFAEVAMALVQTYELFSLKEKAEEIISWYISDGKYLSGTQELHYTLIGAAQLLSKELATKIFSAHYSFYSDRDDKDAMYELSRFSEGAEKLMIPEVNLLVKKIICSYLLHFNDLNQMERHLLEGHLRAYVYMALPEDEDWLLSSLEVLSDGENVHELAGLRRAMECLYRIGTEKCCSNIIRVALRHRRDSLVLETAMLSFVNIKVRAGLRREVAQDIFASHLNINEK